MIRRGVLFLIVLALAALPTWAGVPEGLWVAWATEAYNLEAGESVQFNVVFADIPLRAWILSVEGDQRLCDVNVLRLGHDHLLYQQHDESRHRVRIPWGSGEAVAVTVTADMSVGGVFTIKFLGPPDDTAERAYGYGINRALEALEAGDLGGAEQLLRDVSLRDDEDAGVAYLLLASLAKDHGEPEIAAGLLEMAVQEGFPESMRDIERELNRQLAKIQDRLSPALIDADEVLAAGDGRTAAYRIVVWLEGQEERPYSAWELCEAHRRLGHAEQLEERPIRAQEYLDLALREATNPAQKALVYHRLGLVLVDAGNPDQARRALQAACELGLPPDLLESTEEILNRIPED